MPRKPTGNTYESKGRHYARVTIGKTRRSFLAHSESDAHVLAGLLAPLAKRLVLAGHADLATHILADIAAARPEERGSALRAAEGILAGHREPVKRAPASASNVTIANLAEQWTSGVLARRFPDRIKVKRSRKADVSRLDNHVIPVVGDVLVTEFSIDDGERVLSRLPAKLSAETRRHVARLLARLLSIAVFPLRILAVSPLPRTWIPGGGPQKAKGWIYPDEDRKLLACTRIPLRWRIFWGWLAREGMRVSEAAALDKTDMDVVRGAVRLDENKTDDPRAWATSPGVARAIERWLALRTDDCPALFVDHHDGRIDPHADLAKRLRGHLRRAGITRPELFEKSATRIPIRAHDLRGTFVTIASANGRSEAWVTDRTGHKSSGMVARYRRQARTAAELGLGDLSPLDEAIPELRGDGAAKRNGGGKGGAMATGSGSATIPAQDARPQMAMSATRKGSTAPDSPGSSGVTGAARPSSGGAGAVSPPIRSTRATMAVSLSEQLTAALRDGDIGAAKVAHEALGRLLGAVGEGAPVVDLSTARRGAR